MLNAIIAAKSSFMNLIKIMVKLIKMSVLNIPVTSYIIPI